MSRNAEKITIVILHGWGIDGSRYSSLQKILEDAGFTVVAPDFPGFGLEKLKKSVYNLSDYVKFLDKYLSQKISGNIVLIGHSFGGRVVTKYITGAPAKSLKGIILTGVPLIRLPLSFRKKVGAAAASIGKSILPQPLKNHRTLRNYLYRFIGEMDYLKSGDMKETFVQIIGEDLENLLPEITVPTLLIWGENDKITPLEIAYQIQQKIPQAKLDISPDGTHKLPYEDPTFFARSVQEFISKL